ncbi:glycosyltransferase [Christiangramia echinicola]|uniref:glycosyltransferase n=1 Tax=Christiangramia echinicola TaxID=279359 RepID=UPI0004299B0F|nr:glycosyltransferase [Christiangramia echinicola]
MKILRVIPSMNPKSGGPCRGIRNSIPVQTNIGVINEVVCFDDPDEDFLKTGEKYIIHAIGPASGPYSYCKKLNGWLLDNMNRFDVIMIHGIWLYHSYGTFMAWRKFKKANRNAPRLYVMPHGMLDPYFQRAKSRRLKAVRNWIFWNLIENKVINGADGLLFTCKEELKLARQTFKLYKPKKQFDAGYGVPEPPEKNIRSMWTFLKKCPRLGANSYWLFLSRIHPKKGVDLLIKAYVELKKKKQNIPDLVIAGPGLETPYGKAMFDLAGDSSIHFPGMLNGRAKWAAFHFSDVFILPSHQENFGIAVVEAMACEKPVLITNQINIWREINNAKAGLVLQDTQEGVYNLIARWDSLPEREKEQMGLNAYELYKEKFSVKNAALRMMTCISNDNQLINQAV